MADPNLTEIADRVVTDLRQAATEALDVVAAMRSSNHPALNSTMGVLYATGRFTLEELGQAVGLTRERVRQMIATGDKPMSAQRPLTQKERARLRELHAAADGRNPGRREQVFAYREFIYQLTQRGVSQARIAGALGVTPAAVSQQLRLRAQGAPGRWPEMVQ